MIPSEVEMVYIEQAREYSVKRFEQPWWVIYIYIYIILYIYNYILYIYIYIRYIKTYLFNH